MNIKIIWTLILQICACGIAGNNHHKPKHVLEEYKSQTSRRQQVIHPINDDHVTSKNDDDIEQYGKAIDATGAVINKPARKQTDTSSATKDIIAKIKEIQDKIFKRTNENKVLENKLRLMSPENSRESKSEKFVDVTGDKRKIIPEDVVDKILKKFEQLRTEAKSIALGSTPSDPTKKENKDESGPTRDTTSESKESANAYSSIGPPKESVEILNRTRSSDVTGVGMAAGQEIQDPTPNAVEPSRGDPTPNAIEPSGGDIQIPIGTAGSASSQPPIVGAKSAPGIPIMFIKNGANLIPVYNNGAASGPLASVNTAVNGPLMTGRENQPPVISEASLNQQPNNPPPVMNMKAYDGNNGNPYTRCSVPGGCADSQPTYEKDSTTTNELIDKLLHTRGFPQLASRLLTGGQSRGFETSPQQGDSRNVVPMFDKNVDSMNPATVNFNLKQNFVSDFPDQPSMLQDYRKAEQQNDEPRKFFENQPIQNNEILDKHSSNGRYVNDISDPVEDIESKYRTKSADELLDYAKYKSMLSNDVHPPDTSQINLRSRELEESQRSQYFGGQPKEQITQEPGYEKYMNEDPAALLDELHKTQVEGGLAGPGGDVGNANMRPEEQITESGKSRQFIPSNFESAPDDLLEQVRSFSNQIRRQQQLFDRSRLEASRGQLDQDYRSEPAPDDLLDQVRSFSNKMRDQQIQRSLQMQANRDSINRGFGRMDPSIADEIRGGGLSQQFDVQRKDIATETNMQLLRNGSPATRHGAISVLSDDAVQFKNGRLSMDSNNLINSLKSENVLSRRNIRRPRHHQRHRKKFLHPVTRGVIEKPISLDNDVELRVNGRPLTDNVQLRSTIIDGKVKPGKGKTLISKDPVQIELAHGENKRKIINIVTKGKYDVINEKKRYKIPHNKS